MSGNVDDNIVPRILKGCQSNNVECSEVLASFVARIVMEQDAKSLTDISQNVIDHTVQRSITCLCERDSPSMETIKMQISHDVYCFERHADLQENYKEQQLTNQNAIGSILRKAQSCRHIRSNSINQPLDQAKLDNLYREMFMFVLKSSSVGGGARDDMSKLQTFREAVATAMESVFPRSAVQSFVPLEHEDQKTQLEQLPVVVLGMCVVNAKEAGTEKIGMKDLEKLCLERCSDLLVVITIEENNLSDSCQHFECMLLKTNSSSQKLGRDAFSRQELIFFRQLQTYCQKLHSDVVLHMEKIKETINMYKQETDELKKIVGTKTSASKAIVYPKFESIGKRWMQLDDSAGAIESYRAIHNRLRDFRGKLGNGLGEKFQPRYEADEEETQQGKEKEVMVESHEHNKDDQESVKDKLPEVLQLEAKPDFMDLKLEFRGYCPWTLVNRQGLAVQGKPQIGVVRFRQKHYVFANDNARLSFMKNPSKLLQMAKSVIIQHPALIYLLGVNDQFINYVPIYRNATGVSRVGSRKRVSDYALYLLSTPLMRIFQYVGKTRLFKLSFFLEFSSLGCWYVNSRSLCALTRKSKLYLERMGSKEEGTINVERL